ncbi:MAG TPA: signal peptidase I [Armatimonadota bacterium]|nr:signal peptidase I [Armatimonadota bacterium]
MQHIPDFNRPWHIVTAIAVIVIARLIVSRVAGIGRFRASVVEIHDSLLMAVLLVFCLLRPFVLQTFYIPSDSMVPTLVQQDRIIALRCWYFFTDPKPGDIVVFRAPTSAYYSNPRANPNLNEQKDFIKRIVGAPGDRIRIDRAPDGTLAMFRNGELLDELYVREPTHYWVWPDGPGRDIVVPPNQQVMMGDNRNHSNDSKKWLYHTEGGQETVNAPFVDRHRLMGKAVCIFWPPSRIRILH